jgi:hypothetical protein
MTVNNGREQELHVLGGLRFAEVSIVYNFLEKLASRAELSDYIERGVVLKEFIDF